MTFRFKSDGLNLTAEYAATRTKNVKLTEKVPIDEFSSILFGNDTSFLGLLPAAVRWVSQDGKLIIAERPPHYKDVSYTPALKSNAKLVSKDKFNIAVPWTTYIFTWEPNGYIDFLFAFASDKQIESIDDIVYHLPVPNIYVSGLVCKPNASSAKLTTAGQAINEAYQLLWNSNFNLDIQGPMKYWLNACKAMDPRIYNALSKYGQNVEYGFAAALNFLSEITLEQLMDTKKYLTPKIVNNQQFHEILASNMNVHDIYWDNLVSMINENWFIHGEEKWLASMRGWDLLKIRHIISLLGYNPDTGNSSMSPEMQTKKVLHDLLIRFS